MRAPKGATQAIVRRDGVLVRADYAGGPYIELTFGSEGYHPIEVINIWDYETDRAEPPFDFWTDDPTPIVAASQRAALREAVKEWMRTQDEEWPEWYEGYLENARY